MEQQYNEYILKISDLKKSYSKNEVLKGINLEIEKSKIVALLGPNGCGKSTLIKLINGLLKADSGSILVDNKELGIETKKYISYLPERTYLNNWMKVKDILAFFKDFYEDFDMEKAKKMLVDLSINEDVRLKTLSKGMKEKVQLVLVMSRNTKLYILDEPIAGVDPASREYIMKSILTNLPEEATLLIITHLVQDIEGICDEIVMLADGVVKLRGETDALRQEYSKSIDEIFREVFAC
jgi:ABC transporter, ATP-binding protein